MNDFQEYSKKILKFNWKKLRKQYGRFIYVFNDNNEVESTIWKWCDRNKSK